MQSRDLSIFMEDYSGDCGDMVDASRNGVYTDLIEELDELIEKVNDVNHKVRCMVTALNTIGERRAAEYLRLYGPGLLDQLLETLEGDTKRSLENSIAS